VQLKALPTLQFTLRLWLQRMERLAVIGLLAGVSCTSGSAYAEPLVSEQTIHYPIEGLTLKALRESMDQRSPVVLNGYLFYASTTRSVEWALEFDRSGQHCSVASVNTTVNLTFTLPQISDPNGISEQVKSRWETYYRALVAHERGHGRIGIKAARLIEKAVNQLPAATSCQSLEVQANLLAARILQTANYRDARYDRETGHGELEGAVLPIDNPL